MDLYDDIIISGSEKAEITGKSDEKSSSWSSTGINLLKDHLQLKKSTFHGKKDQFNRRTVAGSSGIGFKAKIVGDELPPPPAISSITKSTGSLLGGEWDVTQEYDPLWPNDYEKIMKERKEKLEKEASEAKAREMEERLRKKREKDSSSMISNMPLRPLVDAYSDDEDDEKLAMVKTTSSATNRGGGAAFPPPPSLIEDAILADKEKPLKMASSMGVSSVAAKIMVKMGYKDGQGLGKEEQGISRALEVQKTSQRGGKIISEHEKEVFVPPTPPPPPIAFNASSSSMSSPSSPNQTQTESITEIMKNPTKIVMLKNMVGRGEVDEDLVPEVKEECSKYGDVMKCVAFEMSIDAPEDEAVRIFIEFKRVESAIKAVVDLNGRYFGGRVVKATFYDVEKFKSAEYKE